MFMDAQLLENKRMDAEIATKVFGMDWQSSNAPDLPPRYSTEIEPANLIINRLRKAGIEVGINCHVGSFSVELWQWKGGTARVSICCITGAITLPAALARSVLRPETLAALAEADGKGI